jgi:TIR domain-containing protein
VGKLSGNAFISYVREDSHNVDKLQQTLEAVGISVWRDTADLWPGEDWRVKIRRAITEDALVFIACFSSRSVVREKSYQNEELLLAIDQLRLRRPQNPWLIPVRFDDCEVPDLDLGGGRTLASIHRADLFGDSRDMAAERLVTVVLRLLGQRSDVQEVRGKCRGWFDSPSDGDPVGTRIAVRGGARDVPPGCHLWIAHRVDPGGLLWPKDTEITLDQNGHFDVYVYEAGSSPRLYLTLLLVTAAMSADFDRWVREGSRTGHYPGLRLSSDSYNELASVCLQYRSSQAT